MTGQGRRKAAAVALGGLLAIGLVACGDDDDGDAGDEAAGDRGGLATSDGGATAGEAFCDAFHNLDVAFAGAPEDPAELGTFLTEQVEPNVAAIESDVPDEIGEPIATMLGVVEEVSGSGDMSAFQSPEFMAAQGEVYPFLAEGCGWQSLDVTAVDFGYEGMPETVEAGMTVLTMENATEAGELHEIALMKRADGADIPLDELLALPEEEAQQYLDPEAPPVFAFAAPGEVGGITADLTPGDYVYVCFIPMGTTMDGPGEGAPHFMEGMAGELTVS